MMQAKIGGDAASLTSFLASSRRVHHATRSFTHHQLTRQAEVMLRMRKGKTQMRSRAASLRTMRQTALAMRLPSTASVAGGESAKRQICDTY